MATDAPINWTQSAQGFRDSIVSRARPVVPVHGAPDPWTPQEDNVLRRLRREGVTGLEYPSGLCTLGRTLGQPKVHGGAAQALSLHHQQSMPGKGTSPSPATSLCAPRIEQSDPRTRRRDKGTPSAPHGSNSCASDLPSECRRLRQSVSSAPSNGKAIDPGTAGEPAKSAADALERPRRLRGG